MNRRRIAPTKYARLVGFLRALPEERQAVSLTLAEIASLVQEPLPASSHTQQFWTVSDSAYDHWRKHGWRASRSHDGERVTFQRQKPQIRPLDHEAIVSAYRAGATGPQLCRRYDLTCRTIYRVLTLAGVPRRPGGNQRVTPVERQA